MSIAAAILVSLAFSQVEVLPEALGKAFVGQRIVVEDVCTSVLGTPPDRQFRLKRCSDVKFIPDGIRLDRIQGELLLVTGRVTEVNGGLVVRVEKIQKLPSDADRFKSRSEIIAPNDYQAWYELSDWALQRSKRFESPEMAENSRRAFQKGVAIERELGAGNEQRLRTLRDRVANDDRTKSYDLAALDHEILRAALNQTRPNTAQQFEKFAESVRETHGGDEKTRPLAKALREAYDADPLGTYAGASESERVRYARYWQVWLLNQAFEAMSRDPNVTAAEVARRSARSISDYPDLQNRWREQGFSDLERNPLRYSAEQAERLCRQAPAVERDRLLAGWLKAQEEDLRRREAVAAQNAKAQGRTSDRNAQARYDLAQLYGNWLPSAPAAQENRKRLLQEVLQIDPGFQQAETALREMGASPRPLRAAPEERAAAGVGAPFRIGMRAADIAVAPDYKARIVAGGKITHQWIYRGLAGGKTTYLTLEPNPTGALIVSDVRN